MGNKLIETLQEGLRDELEGALNYTFLAAKTGDYDLRRKMLIYAKDEINHALKLIKMLEKLEAAIGDVSSEIVDVDDMLDFLVKYKAKEESAVFYYQVLSELLDEPDEKETFLAIKEEEKEHYEYIKELLKELG